MDEVKVTVRLPREVWAQVKARAKAERRSLNAQIVREVEERDRAQRVAGIWSRYRAYRMEPGMTEARAGVIEAFLAWVEEGGDDEGATGAGEAAAGANRRD